MTDKAAPLIITPWARAKLALLREGASSYPIDMKGRVETIRTPAGMAKHMLQITVETTAIPDPFPFLVTFSIENHPVGTCRHMSVSIQRKGRVPSPEAAWMIAELLGFSGGIEACRMWTEPLDDGEVAINLVQPLAIAQEAHEP